MLKFRLKYYLLVLVTISFYLRFWDLNRFNILVFDEVYYAVFANNYLTRTQFFNVHPPLSQYLIAVGIALTSWQDPLSSLSNSFHYRWVNALVGSLIPLLAGAICFQLTKLPSYSIITAIFFTFDGLFLVESRYALSDIYLIFFGLLGHLLLLKYLNQHKTWQIVLAGIFLGCCVGVKWNGLGFLLGGYIFYFLPRNNNYHQSAFFKFFLYLVSIPIVVYVIIWIPHLVMNPTYGGFWEVHHKIINYHSHLGGNQIHPYCSPWYSWLIMARPIAFYYRTIFDGKIIYDVHAMGNPILWWLSTGAIAYLTGELIFHSWKKTVNFPYTASIYILMNYAVNLLPWVKVSRCLFLYHYKSAYSFAIIGLAWVVTRWCETKKGKILAALTIMLIISAFIFWTPIYYGLPLSVREYYLRMWFKSWI